MVDPKRLIESMELCMGAERDCHKCMYCETENDCRDSMIYDAVELLKEKEPIKIKRPECLDEIYDYMAVCPECHMQWVMCDSEKMRYCPGCGRKVKWDADGA